MKLALSHFTSAFLFALCASTVFAITQREEPRAMLRYGGKCFAYFMGGVLAAAWLMWLVKR